MGKNSLFTSRLGRLAVTSACSTALAIGLGAGVASAQDLHSGGESPNEAAVDPGGNAIEVGGTTETRNGGLPVTGSDVAGLVGLGVGAVVVGSGAVAVARRRVRPST
jgi:hypothetical protein